MKKEYVNLVLNVKFILNWSIFKYIREIVHNIIPEIRRPALVNADPASTPSLLPGRTMLVTFDRNRSNIPVSIVFVVSCESSDDRDILSVWSSKLVDPSVDECSRRDACFSPARRKCAAPKTTYRNLFHNNWLELECAGHSASRTQRLYSL